MKQNNIVGVFETKTNLNKIINRVIDGEEFVITKRGIEVAKIIPLKNTKQELLKTFEKINSFKKQFATNFITINEITKFKEEGRK